MRVLDAYFQIFTIVITIHVLSEQDEFIGQRQVAGMLYVQVFLPVVALRVVRSVVVSYDGFLGVRGPPYARYRDVVVDLVEHLGRLVFQVALELAPDVLENRLDCVAIGITWWRISELNNKTHNLYKDRTTNAYIKC